LFTDETTSTSKTDNGVAKVDVQDTGISALVVVLAAVAALVVGCIVGALVARKACPASTSTSSSTNNNNNNNNNELHPTSDHNGYDSFASTRNATPTSSAGNVVVNNSSSGTTTITAADVYSELPLGGGYVYGELELAPQ
jgi:cytoskeletal protein RodZ